MSYTQLTQEQRYQISALLKTEHSQTEIATVIGVHKSTISREVRRNLGKRGYRPKQAHHLALKRRREVIQKRIPVETWARIDEKLRQEWSPEQVSGWLKKYTDTTVSHEWIYQHIYLDKRDGGDLHKHLRCQKKRRKRVGDYDRRGRIPNQVSIEERPEIVELRERVGDWEADTIIGAGKQGAIVTLVERKSRLTLLKQVARRTAVAVEDAILELLRPFPTARYSITFDNGKEFANHQAIAHKLQTDVYFAHPYASWERGTNENTNGLIRQYFPKGANFLSITDDQILFVKERLNARPRKCLDFQAPSMVFSQSLPGCT
ncbi:MAG: IS30 family transposase [Deltaproteobacteria bacterium]|nr:IS30 family transposase [Deltaproteobacteria bacterium]